MSDLKVRVTIELPINVVHYMRGRPSTRWEPEDPPEVDFTVDAPEQVAEWIMGALDNEALQDIETEIIEQADRNYSEMISDWYEARA